MYGLTRPKPVQSSARHVRAFFGLRLRLRCLASGQESSLTSHSQRIGPHLYTSLTVTRRLDLFPKSFLSMSDLVIRSRLCPGNRIKIANSSKEDSSRGQAKKRIEYDNQTQTVLINTADPIITSFLCSFLVKKIVEIL